MSIQTRHIVLLITRIEDSALSTTKPRAGANSSFPIINNLGS
jgi:hypothetical protein